jgi:hypothetical protein
MRSAAAVALASYFSLVGPVHAQSPDEILEGAIELQARLAEARAERNAPKACTTAAVIEAELLAVQRLMGHRVNEMFDASVEGINPSQLDETREEFGRFIGITNVLSRLLGRAEGDCEYLSRNRETAPRIER